MTNKFKIIGGILVLALIVILGIRFLSGEDSWICSNGQWIKHGNPNSSIPTTGCSNNQESQFEYKNMDYGFSLSLPISWQGYSIVQEEWKGNTIDEQVAQSFKGPKILIRHPLWTTENPRQDIPIMVFTLEEWNLIVQEKLSVGAAPIGPSKLGRNAKYVFALPARYYFAYQIGFEEVQKIIESKPLKGL